MHNIKHASSDGLGNSVIKSWKLFSINFQPTLTAVHDNLN